MSGGMGPGLPAWDNLTKEAFLSIVRDRAFYAYWREVYGRKPRVRVKARDSVSDANG